MRYNRRVNEPSPSRCPRCLLQVRWCLCADVPTVVTHTKIVIVRHYREVTRSSNSGRLAAMALPNSVLLDHGAPGTPPTQLSADVLDGARLLFPGGETLGAASLPRTLIILDSTWSQARRMRRKVRGLEQVRTVSLPPVPTETPRMRASPGEGKVSTLEAIAYALGVLEGPRGPEVERQLLALFQLAVERSLATGRHGISLRGGQMSQGLPGSDDDNPEHEGE